MQDGNPLYGVPPPAEGQEAPAPLIRYPSWMDAPYALAVSEARPLQRVAVDVGVRGSIPANASRYALVFSCDTTLSPIFISTFPEATARPVIILNSTVAFVALNLLTHGPLVCAQWFFEAAGAGFVFVSEIQLYGGR